MADELTERLVENHTNTDERHRMKTIAYGITIAVFVTMLIVLYSILPVPAFLTILALLLVGLFSIPVFKM